MNPFETDNELMLLSALLGASTLILVLKASSALREKFNHAKMLTDHEKPLVETTEAKNGPKNVVTDPSKMVLIVDDDRITRLPLRKSFEKMGFHVTEVPDGPSAVREYKDGSRFCMVVMDYEMPDMDGLETTKKIRQYDNEVVIVGSTIHDPATKQDQFLRAGANFVTSKPITLEKLREFVVEYNLSSET